MPTEIIKPYASGYSVGFHNHWDDVSGNYPYERRSHAGNIRTAQRWMRRVQDRKRR